MKNLLIFCAFLLGFTVEAQLDDLMIVEYQDYDPGDGFQVRIYNPTASTVSLSNYYLKVFNNGNSSASSISQLSGTLLPGEDILVGNPHNCNSSITLNVNGVNHDDCIALTLGDTQNWVDMINLYGASVEPMVDGQSDALYHSRLLRKPGNCTRYTSTDGISANSWPSSNVNNVSGWSVHPTACLATAGFSFSIPQGSEVKNICPGDSVLVNGKWRSQPGIYFDTIAGMSFCDSIVATEVKLFNATTVERSFELCENDTVSFRGRKIYSDTSFSFSSVDGSCDTVFEINASILESFASLSYEYLSEDSTEVQFLVSGISDQYEWNFGDGISSRGSENLKSHTYEEGECYQLEVSFENGNGCLITLAEEVCVPEKNMTQEENLLIPNIFTPNGDGVNDYLTISYTGAAKQNFSMQIYNRWGGKIFQSQRSDFRWDGSFDGKPCTEGVYLYVLTLGGETHDGFITLVR